MREEKDFFDVNLACDDSQIQAHKVILSVSLFPIFPKCFSPEAAPAPPVVPKGGEVQGVPERSQLHVNRQLMWLKKNSIPSWLLPKTSV